MQLSLLSSLSSKRWAKLAGAALLLTTVAGVPALGAAKAHRAQAPAAKVSTAAPTKKKTLAQASAKHPAKRMATHHKGQQKKLSTSHHRGGAKKLGASHKGSSAKKLGASHKGGSAKKLSSSSSSAKHKMTK